MVQESPQRSAAVQTAPPPTPAPEPAPAPAPRASTVPDALSVVWEQTLAYASSRTADQALLAELEFEGDRDGVLRLRFVDPTSPTAAFIANDPTRIERTIEQATGRQLRVQLTTPAVAPPAPQKVEIDAKIVENPVVSEAMELFDATIHSVRSMSSEDSSKPSDNREPDGDSNDV